MNLIDRAKQIKDGMSTLTAWLGSGAQTIPLLDAQKRANVCIRCPMNQLGSPATGAIADAIQKQVELKNKLELRVLGEKLLHHCTGCGCVLRLKIHIPITRLGLTTDELTKYDDNCWMRKEFNETQKHP
jgi:hypothetical protein